MDERVELTIRFRTASRAEQVAEMIRPFGTVTEPAFSGESSYPWRITVTVPKARVPYVLGLAGVYGGVVPREKASA